MVVEIYYSNGQKVIPSHGSCVIIQDDKLVDINGVCVPSSVEDDAVEVITEDAMKES